eukprot:gene13162-27846_t
MGVHSNYWDDDNCTRSKPGLCQESTDRSTKTFIYTGSSQTYTVPAGINSITVYACGGQGGTNYYNTGGNGGCIRSLVSVTPFQMLYVIVGDAGRGYYVYASGYNGGGRGGAYIYQGGQLAGGGGGASDVRTSLSDLGTRLVVAGGGGGAGYDGSTTSLYGGMGGGSTGGTGGTVKSGTIAGSGGSQTTGGTAGSTNGNTASTGTVGIGGDAFMSYTGGGGGGGYYGGGGGAFSGAGGGSSWTSGAISENVQGAKTGSGYIFIIPNLDKCWRLTKDTDISGIDLKHFISSATIDQCKEACYNDPLCTFMVFKSSTNECWTKNTAGAVTSNTDRDYYELFDCGPIT